jgi:hypothetical protein
MERARSKKSTTAWSFQTKVPAPNIAPDFRYSAPFLIATGQNAAHLMRICSQAEDCD